MTVFAKNPDESLLPQIIVSPPEARGEKKMFFGGKASQIIETKDLHRWMRTHQPTIRTRKMAFLRRYSSTRSHFQMNSIPLGR